LSILNGSTASEIGPVVVAAPSPATAAVPTTVSACDRQTVQAALDILGKTLDRLVAVARLNPQRFQHDVVERTGQLLA
jgi:hypothetical protein